MHVLIGLSGQNNTIGTVYSKNHFTGVKPKVGSSGRHAFRPFDWTMASILGFDWLSKIARHAYNISVHLACSADMVFTVSCETIMTQNTGFSPFI